MQKGKLVVEDRQAQIGRAAAREDVQAAQHDGDHLDEGEHLVVAQALGVGRAARNWKPRARQSIAWRRASAWATWGPSAARSASSNGPEPSARAAGIGTSPGRRSIT